MYTLKTHLFSPELFSYCVFRSLIWAPLFRRSHSCEDDASQLGKRSFHSVNVPVLRPARHRPPEGF